jgi:UDP-N-acetylmuramate--alanine ligase
MKRKLINVAIIGCGVVGLRRKYFIEKNKNVFGYDREKSMITIDLTKMGAKVDYNLENITLKYNALPKDDTVVIYTPAIPNNHILLNYFTENDFDIYKRADILENISRKSKTIAIAGTHGKTTTTSILAHIMKCADVSFLAFVGGIMENYNSNYIYSGDDYIIVEADEFDKSFLKLNPDFACITSMDVDHLDVYQDSTKLIEAFREIKNNLKPGGFILSNENVEIDSIK